MEGSVAKRFVSCRKRRLDTGTLVTVMKQTILLTGDASEKVEEAVVQANPNLQFSILKVGHHGEQDISGETLLKLVQPRLAFISCGSTITMGIRVQRLWRARKLLALSFSGRTKKGKFGFRFTREKLEVTTSLRNGK